MRALCLAAALCLCASQAWAQALTAGITGTVRDESQAVLPGVTIEASSPVLIEKVRSTITDGEGRYNFVDLVPGTYTVTFTLPGFKTFVRDGVAINAGFTATVNGDMSVGGIEESITVSGAAPVVDTQNVRKQTTASRDILDSLPVST
ncbi:MAG: carboxypeptidase-like regulatory domain-containing protein, partial [Vicinamibacterales bacterium]